MTDKPFPTTRQTFLEALAEARTRLWDFINGLRPEQLRAKRDAGGWSILDHLAHLGDWEKGITALLQKQPRWETMGLDPAFVKSADGFDAINEVLRGFHKDQSTDQVLSELRAIQDAFDTVIAHLDPADFDQPYIHFDPTYPNPEDTRPILTRMVGNTAGHYLEHLPWMKALV